MPMPISFFISTTGYWNRIKHIESFLLLILNCNCVIDLVEEVCLFTIQKNLL